MRCMPFCRPGQRDGVLLPVLSNIDGGDDHLDDQWELLGPWTDLRRNRILQKNKCNDDFFLTFTIFKSLSTTVTLLHFIELVLLTCFVIKLTT